MNGDLSPPHIISRGSPTEGVKGMKDEKLSLLSSSALSVSSPELSLLGTGQHSPTGVPYLSLTSGCPYAGSPWLDKYDEAVACHYSQELRAKLPKTSGSGEQEFSRNFDDGESKWRLGSVPLENGKSLKILLANRRIEKNEAVIEFIGKFKTLSQYEPGK